jgi:hypothetical protein
LVGSSEKQINTVFRVKPVYAILGFCFVTSLFSNSALAQGISLSISGDFDRDSGSNTHARSVASGQAVRFGSVNTWFGQPATGQRIRVKQNNGAHFIATLHARVQTGQPSNSMEMRPRSWRAHSHTSQVAPKALERKKEPQSVDIYIRSSFVTAPCSVSYSLTDNTDWAMGEWAGLPLGPVDVPLATDLPNGGGFLHQLSLFIPDHARGVQQAEVMYTAIPHWL